MGKIAIFLAENCKKTKKAEKMTKKQEIVAIDLDGDGVAINSDRWVCFCPKCGFEFYGGEHRKPQQCTYRHNSALDTWQLDMFDTMVNIDDGVGGGGGIMRVALYVFEDSTKKNYAHECFNVRKYAGLMVVADIASRAGHDVEFASSATLQRYDVVMVSITSDCDWWQFIRERIKWQDGNYKVIVGGAGVLNVRPFLQYADYFVLGRAEGVIDRLLDNIDGYQHASVVNSSTFSADNECAINQSNSQYPHKIRLEDGSSYKESQIGCNHKCLFCSYTWHRKHTGGEFVYGDLWAKNTDVELAMIDLHKGREVNINRLRTTAIDGMSERLRFAVKKKITREMVQEFTRRLVLAQRPHQTKYYNIIGYPNETEGDWWEFLDDLREADKGLSKSSKQASVLLHSTPFRAMPATPMACAPMSYRNYRGEVARVLGAGLKGNIIYQGNRLWAVESMGTESLATVIMSAIVWRGVESDADNIRKVAMSQKFARAPSPVKQATLEKYFDVEKLFGRYAPENLPTRYLKSYARVEKLWV